MRGQDIVIANFLRQDFLWPGPTAQLSFHYLRDDGGTHFDDNGFLVRPAAGGIVQPHIVETYYLGLDRRWAHRTAQPHPRLLSGLWTQDTEPDRRQTPGYQRADGSHRALYGFRLAAAESGVLLGSGDGDPCDGRGRGFDAIFDNPNFAGDDDAGTATTPARRR